MSDTSTTAMIAGAPAAFPTGAGAPAAPEQRWNTGYGWVLALYPLVSWIPPYLVLFGAGTSGRYDPADPYDPATLPLTAAANGLSFLLVLLPLAFAVPDARTLRSWGHRRVAHPAWVLLSPVVYLIVRTVHLNRSVRRGSAPLWVCTAATAVATCLSVVFVFAATWPALVSAFDPAMADASAGADYYAAPGSVEDVRAMIEADYRRANSAYTLDCPGVRSIEPGSSFTCDVSIPSGVVVRHVAVEMSPTEPGAFTYWALAE